MPVNAKYPFRLSPNGKQTVFFDPKPTPKLVILKSGFKFHPLKIIFTRLI